MANATKEDITVIQNIFSNLRINYYKKDAKGDLGEYVAFVSRAVAHFYNGLDKLQDKTWTNALHSEVSCYFEVAQLTQ